MSWLGVEQVVSRLVGGIDEAANLDVDLLGRVLREVAMLSDLAAEEDLLFLLAVGHRTESAHAKLADHLAGELGDALDVVAGAGGHLAEEDLFGATSAHEGGEARLEILAW